MSLEIGSFIDDLTTTNPTATDPVGQGDDHLRLIKSVVKNTFPQMGTQYGKIVLQDASTTILALQNTNSFNISQSATTTTLLTLPASASITSGWFIDLNTGANGNVTVTPSSGSINGAASFSMPPGTYSRVRYQGGNFWHASRIPNNLATAQFNSLASSGSLTVSGTVVLTIGQISFPSTQVPSADPNTLDDYEEGTFTPALTYATPGTFSVTYTTQSGRYVKIGRWVYVDIEVTTLTFVRGTASGRLNLTGLPFTHTAETSYSAADIGGFVLVLTAVTQTDPTAVLSGTTTVAVFNMVDHASGTVSAINNNIVPGATNTINFQMQYRI